MGLVGSRAGSAAGLVLGVACLAPLPAHAESETDLRIRCVDLAKLTENALRENRTSDVVGYMRSAQRIRAQLGDPDSCELGYFGRVWKTNQRALEPWVEDPLRGRRDADTGQPDKPRSTR